MGCKDRPVPVGESPEVMDVGERAALRGCNERPGKLWNPVVELGDIIAVGMNHDDGSLPVHVEEFLGCTIEIGENGIGPDPVGIEDKGCRVCSEHGPFNE